MNTEQFKIEVYELIKYFVNVNGLVGVLMKYDTLLEKNDIIHNVWVDFFERGYDEKFSETGGRSLKSYVFQTFKWYMFKAVRTEIVNDILSNVDLDYYVDENQTSPEKLLIEKEISNVLEEFLIDDNRLYVEGTSQADIGRVRGVSRQYIHQKIMVQRKRLERLLRKYYKI